MLPSLALLCTLGVPARFPRAHRTASGCLRRGSRRWIAWSSAACEAAGFPGAAVIIGRRDATVLSRGYGTLDWSPSSTAVSPERTLYDLASLTKVVATTSAVMVLYDERRISLDAPVSRYLPASRAARSARHDSRAARASLGAARRPQSRASHALRSRARARARADSLDPARIRARNRAALFGCGHGRPRLRRRGDRASAARSLRAAPHLRAARR